MDYIRITKEELAALYRENTSEEAGRILNITPPTLRSLLRRHGIPLKGKGNKTNHPKKIEVIDE